MRAMIVVGALCAFSVSLVATAATDYPSRPVKVVVPYAPGGGLDVVGRPLLKRLTESLQQQFVLENRPGAGTTIGSAYAAKAAPDGYTLLLALRALSIGPTAYKNLPYDPEKDLVPISLITLSGSILCVHPAVPVRNAKQFVAYARTHAGKLNYSSSGTGSDQHLMMVIFEQMTGIRMTHIPYSGGGPAFTALMSGQTDAMLAPGSFALPFINVGKVRALVVAGPSRWPDLPNVPTLIEEKFNDIPGSWSGLFAPKGTSRDIVVKLNAEVQNILQDPEMRKFYLAHFLIPLGGTPEMLGDRLRDDVAMWRDLVQKTGIIVQ